MQKSNYEVEVLVNGHPVQEYFKDAKHYIEARKSKEFSLKIRNNGSRRIVAVPSVDGLSVLSGKEAQTNSEGYIINGYDSLVIDGWRVSNSEVKKFFFTDSEESYAERKGNGENLGVIGVAIFREKEQHTCPDPIVIHKHYPKRPYWPHYPIKDWPWDDGRFPVMDSLSSTAATTSSSQISNKVMSLKAVSQDVGTGWGGGKESNVISISFDREDSPDAVFEIYYNTKEQLKKLGIDFGKKPQYISPQAFPGKYCEPPK